MSERALLLLRRGSDGGFTEVASVLHKGKGKTLTVRWPDGTEETYERRSDEITVEHGSIVHLLRVSPRALESTLRSEPASVFRQLLAETGRAMRASDLKERLGSLDRSLVDKAWDRAKRELDTAEDVTKSASRPPAYRLFRSEAAAAQPIPSGGVSTAQTASSPPALAESTPERSRDTSGSMEATSAIRSPSIPRATPQVTATPSFSEGKAGPATDPLVSLLAKRFGGSGDEDLEALAARPLSLSIDLGKLKAAELKAELADLDAEHRQLMALVLGRGKERLLEADLLALPAEQHEAGLRAGLGEIAAARTEAAALVPSEAAMLERALAAGPLPPGLLVDLARTFADHRDAGRRGLDLALGALARWLSAEGTFADPSIDLRRVASAARRAEFARTGGRASWLATLHRVSPDLAADPVWWDGATFDQLAAAGHGPLATALGDATIAESVVRPLVEEVVRGTETRAGLARLWAAPHPLARWVGTEDLKHAMLRIGKRDEIARSWAEGLTDVAALEQMSSQVDAAEQDAAGRREESRVLRERVRHLEAEVRTAGQHLAAARSAHVDTRQAHENQIKLELLRTIARMAAQVGQSVAAAEDAALQRSIAHAAAREGLEAIGQTGDHTVFDPAIHDPMGQQLAPGSPAIVGRQGYTWVDGANSIVLLKAQVVPDRG